MNKPDQTFPFHHTEVNFQPKFFPCVVHADPGNSIMSNSGTELYF